MATNRGSSRARTLVAPARPESSLKFRARVSSVPRCSEGDSKGGAKRRRD